MPQSQDQTKTALGVWQAQGHYLEGEPSIFSSLILLIWKTYVCLLVLEQLIFILSSL